MLVAVANAEFAADNLLKNLTQMDLGLGTDKARTKDGTTRQRF